MFQLTEQQRQQLTSPMPVAIDPSTKVEYVLVRRQVFERMQSLLGDDVLATGELVDQIMVEDDANDPTLESYQTIARETKA